MASWPEPSSRLSSPFLSRRGFDCAGISSIASTLAKSRWFSGALACMSINWDRSDSYGVIALKIVALVAGLNASVLSAARGGWLAIPVVFAVWARLVSKQFSRAVLAFGAVGLILAMVGS